VKEAMGENVRKVNCLLCGGSGEITDPPEISGSCPGCEGTGRVTKDERARQEQDVELLRVELLDTVTSWKHRN